MKTISSSDNELEMEVEADFQEGKVIIFDVSKDVLDIPQEELVVKIDEKVVKSVTRDEVLEVTGEDPSFAILENEDFLQVYLYSPSLSTHTVTIGKVTPGGLLSGEVLMGFGIALLVTVVSAAYIFRQKKEY